jgi:deoxyribonuclease-4
MKYVGAHVPLNGGISSAPQYADSIGAKAFACFVKNQRQWEAKPLTIADITAFRAACDQYEFSPDRILPHDSYLINLAHPDQECLERSRDAFIAEIKRCEQLGLVYLNFHPGSTLKRIPVDQAIENIANSINIALAATESLTLLLENTAGQGGDVGYQFEHIAAIIDLVADKQRVGVCIDTCHTFAAGYDLRTQDDCARTFALFAQTVGWQYLRAMHLNGAKVQLGSRVDRHESLQSGYLGLEVFKFIMQDAHFNNIPLILETINPQLWPQEIELLYGMQKTT